MKKAYLVDFTVCTRVIAESEDEAEALAIIRIRDDMSNHMRSVHFIRDNIIEVNEDEACPIEPGEEDK